MSGYSTARHLSPRGGRPAAVPPRVQWPHRPVPDATERRPGIRASQHAGDKCAIRYNCPACQDPACSFARRLRNALRTHLFKRDNFFCGVIGYERRELKANEEKLTFC